MSGHVGVVKVLLEEGKATTVDTPSNTGSICDGWACFGKLRAASQDLRFGDPGRAVVFASDQKARVLLLIP